MYFFILSLNLSFLLFFVHYFIYIYFVQIKGLCYNFFLQKQQGKNDSSDDSQQNDIKVIPKHQSKLLGIPF